MAQRRTFVNPLESLIGPPGPDAASNKRQRGMNGAVPGSPAQAVPPFLSTFFSGNDTPRAESSGPFGALASVLSGPLATTPLGEDRSMAIDRNQARPEDQGLGSKITYKHTVRAFSQKDKGMYHPMGVPLFVYNRRAKEAPNAISTADVPEINYYAHFGALKDAAKMKTDQLFMGGFRQRVMGNDSLIEAGRPSEFPWNFLGLSHENKNQPVPGYGRYYNNSEQHTILHYTHGFQQCYNLFGPKAEAGDLLYYVVKERDMTNMPLYDFVTGEIKVNSPDLKRPSVLQVEFCVAYRTYGPWFDSGPLPHKDQHDPNEEDWSVLTAGFHPRMCDVGYTSMGEAVAQRSGSRVYDEAAGEFRWEETPNPNNAPMSLERNIMRAGMWGIIGRAKHGWDMEAERTGYSFQRERGHLCRLDMHRLPKVDVILAPSI